VPYCTNCGTEEREGQQFCAVCGARKRDAFATTPMPSLSIGPANSEAQVRLGISLTPPRQSRWSIFFRAVLVLPLGVVAAAADVLAFFVIISAWFCAVFTGRVPDSNQRFLTKVLRFYVNVMAYSYLLTSRWPGLTFTAKPGDQVSFDVDHVQLRRSAALFRLVLSAPAWLVGSALGVGAYPLLIVAWVWGVIAGREPRGIHQALALVLRYQIRFQAYVALLTPTQPFRGFLGDGDETSLTSPVNASVTTPSSSEPPSPSTVDAPVVDGSSTQSSSSVLATRWPVVKSAKVLVVLVMVVGAPLYYLSFSADNPLLHRLQTFIARTEVATSYSVTAQAMNHFESSVHACGVTFTLQCQQRAATRAYPLVSNQSSVLHTDNVYVPTGALSSVRKYEVALDQLKYELFRVQQASSLVSQTQVVSAEIPVTFARVTADYLIANARLNG